MIVVVLIIVILLVILLIYYRNQRSRELILILPLYQDKIIGGYRSLLRLDGKDYEVIPDTGSSLLLLRHPNENEEAVSDGKVKFLGGQVTKYRRREGYLDSLDCKIVYGAIIKSSGSNHNVMGLRKESHNKRKDKVPSFLDSLFSRDEHRLVRFDFPGGVLTITSNPSRLPSSPGTRRIPFDMSDRGYGISIVSSDRHSVRTCLWDTGSSRTLLPASLYADLVFLERPLTLTFLDVNHQSCLLSFPCTSSDIAELPNRPDLFPEPVIVIGTSWLKDYCCTFDYRQRILYLNNCIRESVEPEQRF